LANVINSLLEIKKEIPRHIWSKGEVFYREGRVELDYPPETEDEDDFFCVELSVKDGKYFWGLSLFISDKEVQPDCRCSQGLEYQWCKHGVAALLFCVNGKIILEESLRGHGNAPYHPALEAVIRENLTSSKDTKSPKVYSLVFGLVNNSPISQIADNWKLEAYCHYIKKDGSKGRLIRYVPGLHLTPLKGEEEILLSKIINAPDRRLPLFQALPYLKDHPQLPLILEHKKRITKPIRILSIKSIQCDFHPVKTDPDPAFTPALSFLTPQGTFLGPWSREELILVQDDLQSYLFILKEGYILGVPILPHKVQVFLEPLINSPILFSQKDIHWALEEKSLEGPLFQLHSPPPVKEGGKAPFRTRLILKQRGSQIDFQIQYYYSSQILSPSSDLTSWTSKEGGKILIYHRDMEGEKKKEERLFRLGCDFDNFEKTYFFPDTLENFLQALERGELLPDLDLYLERMPLHAQGKIQIQINSGIDWLELRATIQEAPLSTSHFTGEIPLVEHQGKLYRISLKDREKLQALSQRGHWKEEILRIHLRDFQAYPYLEELENISPEVQRMGEIYQAFKEGFSWNKDSPSLLKGTLRPYQQEGLEWLRFLRSFGLGGILADDMGLGKTIQALALTGEILKNIEEALILIVAPVSTLGNWQQEIQRFLPGWPVHLHLGQEKLPRIPSKGLVLTSYQTFSRERQKEVFTQDAQPELLILDEAQVLKNPRTNIYKSLLSFPSKMKLLLSGTPLENSIQDLWALINMANPSYLGTFSNFKKQYGTKSRNISEKQRQLLQKKIRPFLLRRTKEEVAKELPPKEEAILWVRPSSGEQEIYRKIQSDYRTQVQSLLRSTEPWRGGIKILQALTTLRMAAISPSLVTQENPPLETSAKIIRVLDKLEEALREGHKVLLFSQYTKALALIKHHLDQRDYEYSYLDGSTRQKEREKAIHLFQSGQRDLFLLSLKAGGVGLNLIEADYVFLMDPWWNPAAEAQAIDRTHRIGQDSPVMVYRFITMGTVEEKVLQLQQDKQDLVQRLLGGDKSLFNSLTPGDIEALFQD